MAHFYKITSDFFIDFTNKNVLVHLVNILKLYYNWLVAYRTYTTYLEKFPMFVLLKLEYLKYFIAKLSVATIDLQRSHVCVGWVKDKT